MERLRLRFTPLLYTYKIISFYSLKTVDAIAQKNIKKVPLSVLPSWGVPHPPEFNTQCQEPVNNYF